MVAAVALLPSPYGKVLERRWIDFDGKKSVSYFIPFHDKIAPPPLLADDDIPPPPLPRKPLPGRRTPSVPSGPPAVPTSSRPSQRKQQPQKTLLADDDIPPPTVPRKPLQGRPTTSVPSGPPAVPTSSRPSQPKPQPQKPLPADDDIPPPTVPRKPLQGRPTPSVPSGPPAKPTSSRPSQPKPQPQKFLHTYDKLAGQRGLLLVINFKFAGQNERTASEDDVRKLHTFFSELDYDIVCQSDMTTNELKRSLEKIRYEYLTRQSHKYHCFICVIMSHGSELGIATQDGTIKVDDLVRPFKNDNAFSFIGKPKIFIIQSCRGGRSQVKEQYIEPNIINEADSTVCARLPTDADIIKIFATTPGYYSYRKVDSTSWRGAWFIQAFIAVARELPKSHIQEILTAVTHELAINPEYEIDGEKCQLPMFEAALSKLFYLK
ncbi:caspase-3-like [Mytilus trossulus]|uniref:caspase-3-like n=1 Tax=Mytilus trossulus TaxID=6551 RepID=UPI003003D00B